MELSQPPGGWVRIVCFCLLLTRGPSSCIYLIGGDIPFFKILFCFVFQRKNTISKIEKLHSVFEGTLSAPSQATLIFIIQPLPSSPSPLPPSTSQTEESNWASDNKKKRRRRKKQKPVAASDPTASGGHQRSKMKRANNRRPAAPNP